MALDGSEKVVVVDDWHGIIDVLSKWNDVCRWSMMCVRFWFLYKARTMKKMGYPVETRKNKRSNGDTLQASDFFRQMLAP